jgi:hypothetical protein
MSKRRALSATILTVWAGAAAVIATACASGALDDTDPIQTGGAPGTFAGSGNSLGGSGPTSSGGTSSASGASGTLGGSVGNGGSSASNGGSVSSMGGGSSANGGDTSTMSGGVGSGAGGSTGSGGSTSNCADTPPPNGDTCAHAVEYGWCSQDWLNGACARSCGKCAGGASGGATGSGGNSSKGGGTGSGGTSAKGGSTSSGGSTASGGTTASGGATTGGPYGGGGGQPPRLDSGTNGWASRFWDCCKPACGWKANVGGRTPVTACSAQNQSLGGNYDAKNACESGGSAHMCWSFAPWAVSETLAYGYAAVNMGADYCGKCYQLQFTGGSHNGTVDKGSQGLANKTMIVQAINNGGVQSNQFDLLVPGGGVGDFDACSAQWGTSDLGERYGGFFLACQKQNGFDYDKSRACAAQKCQSVFGSKPDLLEGCNWFVNWFGAPDNPALIFKEITCPDALTTKSGLRR